MGKKIQSIGNYNMDDILLGKGAFARVELATHTLTEMKDSADIPADKDANRPACDDPTILTVDVEQFCSWSACKINNLSSASTTIWF